MVCTIMSRVVTCVVVLSRKNSKIEKVHAMLDTTKVFIYNTAIVYHVVVIISLRISHNSIMHIANNFVQKMSFIPTLN